jgi:hypothetical protein
LFKLSKTLKISTYPKLDTNIKKYDNIVKKHQIYHIILNLYIKFNKIRHFKQVSENIFL